MMLLLLSVVMVADQASKAAAPSLASGRLNRWILPLDNPGLTLELVAVSRWPLVATATLLLVAFGAYTFRLVGRGRLAWWSPPLLVGGALGNLADRIVLGAVRDFLAVGPVVVNLADIAVLLGVAGYMASLVRGRLV